MSEWYPAASRGQDYSKKFVGSKMNTNCVVLHSTEGTGWPTYKGGASAPHVTVRPNFQRKVLEVRQHFPANRSARALVNSAGGVETNTLGVFQIEIVGTCDPSSHRKWKEQHFYMPELPDWAIRDLAKLLVWLRSVHPKVQLEDGAPRGWGAYPSSYGKSKYRMTQKEWLNNYRIVGHQHVPENAHGDPGNFPIEKLVQKCKSLTAAPVTPPTPDPVVPPAPPGGVVPQNLDIRHISMQWTDNAAQQDSDVRKLASLAAPDVWTGTEGGEVRAKLQKHLGVRYHVFTPSSSAQWIAIRKSLVEKVISQKFTPIIPASSKLPKPKSPKKGLITSWGPKGLNRMEVQLKSGTRLVVYAVHCLPNSRSKNASITLGASFSYREKNRELLLALDESVARDVAAGKVVVIGGDYNAYFQPPKPGVSWNRNHALFDTNLVSAWQETGFYPDTGHGNIDGIVRSKSDTKSKFTKAKVWTDSTFRLNTDHYLIGATLLIS